MGGQYKDEYHDFLGLAPGVSIVDSLATEIAKAEVHRSDLVFKLAGTEFKKGAHVEHEADLSRDDLIRIRMYNGDLSYQHNMEFDTIIITTCAHCRSLTNSNSNFQPDIIELNERDSDVLLKEIEEKIDKGEEFSRLDLVYLPLGKSSKTSTELMEDGAKLAFKANKGDTWRHTTIFLMLMAASKFLPEKDIRRIWEEMVEMDASILDVLAQKSFEDRIRKAEEKARKAEEETRKGRQVTLAVLREVAKGAKLDDVLEIVPVTPEELDFVKGK
jgi:hypothetical protein